MATASAQQDAAAITTLQAARPIILQSALVELVAAEQTLKTTDVYYELGLVFEYGNNRQAAQETFTRGLRIAPGSLKLLNKRAYANWRLGNTDAAQADFTRATSLSPVEERDELLLAEANAWVGTFLTQQEQVEKTLRHAARSLAFLLEVPNGEPERYMVLHNLGCVYGGLSDLREHDRDGLQTMAIEMLNRALEEATRHGKRDLQVENIKAEGEEYFPAALKARPEFQQLLLE